MGTSALPIEPLSDQSSLSSDPFVFGRLDHDIASKKDDFSQPWSTAPAASCDNLGLCTDEGYEVDQYLGASKRPRLSPFSFDSVSPPHEPDQTMVLTTVAASPLAEKKAVDQDYFPQHPQYSSNILVQDEFDLSQSDTTYLPDVNFDDFFSLPTINSPPRDDFNQPTVSPTPSESIPGLNMDQGSIMVASNDPNCLDETNKSEKSPMEEASTSVPPPKKSKRIGRPPKRRSVDAHNNTDRTERPGKRLCPDLTWDELGKCTGDITANQEVTTESPTPELPFRLEDIEKLLSPVDDSPLKGDFLDIIVQCFAACSRHVTAISDSAWATEEPVKKTLSCDETSIFILSVDINGQSTCMVFHMAQREAHIPLMGQKCDEDRENLKQMAGRFVNSCLPEPFDNWDHGWKKLHDTDLQIDARNGQFHYLWVVMNITMGKVPPRFDRQLLRSYLYGICVAMNHLAGAPAVPRSGGLKAKSAAKRNGDTLKTLWDLFSSTEVIQSYQDNALSQSFEGFQNIGLAGFANDDSRKTFLCTMADAYRDTRASELKPIQEHADYLVVLTDAFCDSGTMSSFGQSELDKEEAALRRIGQDITYLQKAPLNWKFEVAQALGKIADERRKSVTQCWFLEALRLVDVPGTVTRVKQLREQVKKAPLQAVEHIERSNII